MPDPILTYRMYSMVSIKGTLMQVWKSPYVCVHIKTIYPENFAFLTFTIHQLFTREVCKFLKNLANFYLIQLFLNVCKQTFHISHARTSQKVKGVLIWNLQHTIFMWRQRCWQIFKSVSVSLWTMSIFPIIDNDTTTEVPNENSWIFLGFLKFLHKALHFFTTYENDNVPSHDQEERKMNKILKANCGAH